ncbi:MAG: HAD family hydrolase [Bryobacteraceae bacterium]|nr:HAD family hydrolase [Solibacteraceae bacterium]MCL4841321.1 HAD family hydrolase [Bryobacteraceae bacterium]MCO5350708.1 HAD family hydrolase [Bryobacteraceae bacterium]HAX43864.1 hydrolase [Bryobacterales bacterium]HRJ17711.1 HAD family hydrolase [Bryobacteraceae bacterium]
MRQHLIIDADDTLWENNIFFEEAFDDFCAFLEHSSLTPEGVRGILDEIELANARTHGYGSLNFARNLQQCYRRLAEREVLDGDLEVVKGFALRILEQPVDPLPGVAETLEYLASRHDLALFTKGHPEEQKLKIDRSGLGVWFGHTAIVKEKDVASYRSLVGQLGWPAERTWMVGNSPKSDINPALEAGLNAVFVPHERTWTLERQPLREEGPGRLEVVREFAALRSLF